MQTDSCKDWAELAYDPAAQQRLADAARNEAMDSIFSGFAASLRRKLRGKANASIDQAA
jgi:hypothetical protein